MSATERELVAAGAEPAMASFYVDHETAVRRFCASLCPPERLEEAMEAAFLDFVARASAASSDVELEDLLCKAARDVAASRMDPTASSSATLITSVCHAIPELLAARANGELPTEYAPLTEHLRSCRICRGNHGRLKAAEAGFGTLQRSLSDGPGSVDSGGYPPEAQSVKGAPMQPSVAPVAGPDRRPWHQFSSTPSPIRVRARRGGLFGAVRRLTGR